MTITIPDSYLTRRGRKNGEAMLKGILRGIGENLSHVFTEAKVKPPEFCHVGVTLTMVDGTHTEIVVSSMSAKVKGRK